ncbi:hypothetical protein HanPI659440_Chr01g0006151 [Helianthus annuus]|uniref:Uncharacterized protein n=1 Tax=Helianthus annuus TaxID=4232 RepID=A0A9K3P2E5_HELAN|nr:hypothetical protein HanXRQr2_Chr01g0007221 [Helianthus annuus]KAJ0610627.1 hypothetical protein HanHA300_Chr01g0005851 [Helianthus annuus]KAJ0625876.1 hypothetical protein HanHA89_Chr01g0006541 [Helianthus annuus]KAJ0808690.1 hypothetical protein HanPI659440_Chr01g0006151 [Helianthus annuus]KAJ0823860.1 hypothetical protein HanLR1_Chr00c0163g0722401 [Helianthus annuus]
MFPLQNWLTSFFKRDFSLFSISISYLLDSFYSSLKKARSSPSTPLVGFMLKRRNYHNNYKRSWACPTSVFQRSCV